MPEFETDEASDCGGGIHLIAVDHSSVTHNKVFDNAGGILVTDETGPSSFNFIAENNVHENPYGSGIALASNAPANSVAPSATVTFA
jgi:parallel beta-helix repeat protein